MPKVHAVSALGWRDRRRPRAGRAGRLGPQNRAGAALRLTSPLPYGERLTIRTDPAALAGEAADGISDLQFTASYRVPFQFSRYVRERLKGGGFLQSSAGVKVTDLDGNELYDLTGSYGVNVFGYDFYKTCMARGSERVAALGPVLGAYHPLLAYNVMRLKAISGLDEVSFHMSGTEAVMP